MFRGHRHRVNHNMRTVVALLLLACCGASAAVKIAAVSEFIQEVAERVHSTPPRREGPPQDPMPPPLPYVAAPSPVPARNRTVRIVLRGITHDLEVPPDMAESLRTNGHAGVAADALPALLLSVQSAISSNTSYTLRALEELLPAPVPSRLAHLELIMGYEETDPGEAGQPPHTKTLLHQLYLDMRASDDVMRLADQACEQLRVGPTPECLEYMVNEINGVFAVPLDQLGPNVHHVDSFSSKAHYTSLQLPSCLLLREDFDVASIADRPRLTVSPPVSREVLPVPKQPIVVSCTCHSVRLRSRVSSLSAVAVLYGILSYSTSAKLPYIRTMLSRGVDMVLSSLFRVHIVLYVTDPSKLQPLWGSGIHWSQWSTFTAIASRSLPVTVTEAWVSQRWRVEVVVYDKALGTAFAWSARNNFLSRVPQHDLFAFFELCVRCVTVCVYVCVSRV